MKSAIFVSHCILLINLLAAEIEAALFWHDYCFHFFHTLTTIKHSILPTPILIFVTLSATPTTLHRMLICCCRCKSSGDDANNTVLVQVNYRKVAD